MAEQDTNHYHKAGKEEETQPTNMDHVSPFDKSKQKETDIALNLKQQLSDDSAASSAPMGSETNNDSGKAMEQHDVKKESSPSDEDTMLNIKEKSTLPQADEESHGDYNTEKRRNEQLNMTAEEISRGHHTGEGKEPETTSSPTLGDRSDRVDGPDKEIPDTDNTNAEAGENSAASSAPMGSETNNDSGKAMEQHDVKKESSPSDEDTMLNIKEKSTLPQADEESHGDYNTEKRRNEQLNMTAEEISKDSSAPDVNTVLNVKENSPALQADEDSHGDYSTEKPVNEQPTVTAEISEEPSAPVEDTKPNMKENSTPLQADERSHGDYSTGKPRNEQPNIAAEKISRGHHTGEGKEPETTSSPTLGDRSDRVDGPDKEIPDTDNTNAEAGENSAASSAPTGSETNNDSGKAMEQHDVKKESSPSDEDTMLNIKEKSTLPQADEESHGDYNTEKRRNEQLNMTAEEISKDSSAPDVNTVLNVKENSPALQADEDSHGDYSTEKPVNEQPTVTAEISEEPSALVEDTKPNMKENSTPLQADERSHGDYSTGKPRNEQPNMAAEKISRGHHTGEGKEPETTSSPTLGDRSDRVDGPDKEIPDTDNTNAEAGENSAASSAPMGSETNDSGKAMEQHDVKKESSPSDEDTMLNIKEKSTLPQADEESHGDYNTEKRRNEQLNMTAEEISKDSSAPDVNTVLNVKENSPALQADEDSHGDYSTEKPVNEQPTVTAEISEEPSAPVEDTKPNMKENSTPLQADERSHGDYSTGKPRNEQPNIAAEKISRGHHTGEGKEPETTSSPTLGDRSDRVDGPDKEIPDTDNTNAEAGEKDESYPEERTSFPQAQTRVETIGPTIQEAADAEPAVPVVQRALGGNGMYLLAGVLVLVAILMSLLLQPESPPQKDDMRQIDIFLRQLEKVKTQFPNQRAELWNRSKIHLLRHLQTAQPTEPVSLILTAGHRAEKTLHCLAQSLASAFSSALNASVLHIDGASKASQDSDQVKLDIDSKLQGAFEGDKPVAVINRFEELPPGSTLIFYRYCDHENAAYKKTCLIFTVLLGEEEEIPAETRLSTVEEMVDDHLQKKFLSDEYPVSFDKMDIDKYGGLWSRISHLILPVAADGRIEHEGCSGA